MQALLRLSRALNAAVEKLLMEIGAAICVILFAQVVFRYCDADGKITPDTNPNGSLDNIAGLIDAQGNVLGMMPHPERCAEAMLGNEDGRLIFLSMLETLKKAKMQTVAG